MRARQLRGGISVRRKDRLDRVELTDDVSYPAEQGDGKEERRKETEQRRRRRGRREFVSTYPWRLKQKKERSFSRICPYTFHRCDNYQLLYLSRVSVYLKRIHL